jgi:DNA-binding transcriptional ArsR family regulator
MAMPFEAERVERPVQVEVRPSAVLELTWTLYKSEGAYSRAAAEHVWEATEDVRAAAEQVWAVMADGYRNLPDVSVLAARVDALLGVEADTFLGNLERAVHLDNVGLELRSESPEVREATLDRLARLRADPDLVRRYAEALSHTWDAVRPEWEETGRQVVERTCAEWAERLRQGAGLLDLVPSTHIARRADQERLLAQRRRVVVTPLHFCDRGGSIIDLTAYMHIGGPARPVDGEALRRKEAEHIASRLKVLADGTRVALLRELAAEPASVMDLARRFHLAQPTVSNHVRLLREAGLLSAQKDGARVVYSVPRDQLGQLLDRTRDLLLE